MCLWRAETGAVAVAEAGTATEALKAFSFVERADVLLRAVHCTKGFKRWWVLTLPSKHLGNDCDTMKMVEMKTSRK